MTLLKNDIEFGLGLPIGVRIIRRVAIPKAPAPVTFGQHLKSARLQRSLRQIDAAKLLGVSQHGYIGWETDMKFPLPRYIPSIVLFVGYDPMPAPETCGQRLRHLRLLRGLTSQEMAEEIGVNQSTVLAREAGK